LNVKLNSIASIRVAYYQALVVLAKRMYAYVHAWRTSLLVHRHRLLVKTAVRLASGRGGLPLPSVLSRGEVRFLAMRAYERAWAGKGGDARALLEAVKQALRPADGKWRRRLKSMLGAQSHGSLDLVRS
jgi:hypothetical protein